MTDKERLEEVKELVKNIESILYDEWRQQELTNLIESLYYDDHVDWLIRTVERYEKALENISKIGWLDRFGGGFSYTGENHAECVKIAKQALEGENK